MNNVAKLFLAFFLILGFFIFVWKIGLFDIIGGSTSSPDGTYETVSIEKIFEDFDNNAAAAEDKYVGNYFSITGKISEIDSSYIVIYPIGDFVTLNRVFCRIKSEEQRNIIKTMNKNDIVTVKGKITDIGELKRLLFKHYWNF